MGDRSSVTYVIPDAVYRSSKAAIEEIIGIPETEDLVNGAMQLFCPEEQGGGYQSHLDLVEAKIPFLSYWSAGCEYAAGAHCFVPDLGDQEVITSESDGRTPLVSVMADGSVGRVSLEEAQEFIRLLAAFDAMCLEKVS